MDRRRVGRSLHVLRRARSLRQADVAAAAGVSQPTVSAIERGRFGAMPLRTLERVFDAVEADIDLVVRHRGGEIDRLLDEGHARLVVQVARVLRAAGWQAVPEVTFNHYGDRGSIDLLAHHAAARVVLVVEVKTVVHSAEETLRRLDVKARIAPAIARERFGETSHPVVRLLAIRGSTANRERIRRMDDLFSPAFPLRGRRLVSWLHAPGPGSLDGEAGALMFVRDIGRADRTAGRRRPGVPGRAASAPHRA